MQMMVKPVLPDVASSAEPKARLTKAQPPRSLASSTGPLHWARATLTSFIDMIEPVVLSLSAGTRLVAVESSDGKVLTFHIVSHRRSSIIGSSTDEREALIKAIKRTKIQEADLRLDPERLATAQFKIPVAGIEFAPQIIESRLDRLTPWRPNDVIHGHALASRPGPDGQIDVEFAATAATIATASVEHLAKFGLAASALGSAAEPLTERLRIDLYGGRGATTRRSRRRTIGAFAIAAVTLSLLAHGLTLLWVYQSSERVAVLDTTLAKARNRLVQASGSSADRDKDFAFIATKNVDDARFQIIDRLASALPDSTYLDELDLDASGIRIAGSSTEASNLIRLLEDDKTFFGVRFSAPVVRQEDDRDRFEITASYVSPPKEAAP
jgi:general secretion pathway protein L